MGVIVVTGTPGAGKSTVLQGALQKTKDYSLINYGDEMFAYAKKAGIVQHRDELRKQTPETQKKIQKMAARRIARAAKKSRMIVDTHCTIKTSEGYLPGLPVWVCEELRPDKIILVEADPGEIISRRKGDTTRQRDAEEASAIQEQQDMNRAAAISYSILSGAVVKIVKNRDNGLAEAIEAMVKALR